ncbi:hypothetical protein JCM19238_4383 [Vibrio ponticus]|nr:hypothetical protein JCM19238_4383 [Vibrio ponticus]
MYTFIWRACSLSAVTPPEMFRESLTEAMLASASCNEALSELDFLDQLPEKSLAQAKQILLDMAAIEPSV